jgi:hypothetical protein
MNNFEQNIKVIAMVMLIALAMLLSALSLTGGEINADRIFNRLPIFFDVSSRKH